MTVDWAESWRYATDFPDCGKSGIDREIRRSYADDNVEVCRGNNVRIGACGCRIFLIRILSAQRCLQNKVKRIQQDISITLLVSFAIDEADLGASIGSFRSLVLGRNWIVGGEIVLGSHVRIGEMSYFISKCSYVLICASVFGADNMWVIGGWVTSWWDRSGAKMEGNLDILRRCSRGLPADMSNSERQENARQETAAFA